MNYSLHKKNTGFTLIETLVAVTILMIAVAGPLVAAGRSLNAALYSGDQMIASFLAQEQMEIIKNVRSNHVGSWTSQGSPVSISSCIGIANKCDITGLPFEISDSVNIQSCPSDGSCLLELTSSGYIHNGTPISGKKFYRYFYLEPMTNPADAYKVHVVVEWVQGKIPYQIEVVSELVNAVI